MYLFKFIGYNKEIRKRSKENSFKDVIYYSMLLIGNDQSYDKINAILKNNIHSNIFNNLNNQLLDYIYENK